MEPLNPASRDALKREHPGLTDEVIARAEELLSERFLVDPEEEPLRAREIDRKRTEVERAWSEELGRRVAELRSGQVQPIPGEQVFDELKSLLR